MTKVMNSQNWHNTFSAAASVAPIVLWSAHSQGAGNVYLAAKNTFLEFYTDEKKAIRRSAAARSWSWDSRVTGEKGSAKSTYAPTTRSPSPSNHSVGSNSDWPSFNDGVKSRGREFSPSFNQPQHQEVKNATSCANYHGTYGNYGGYHAGDVYPFPAQPAVPSSPDAMPCADQQWMRPYQTSQALPQAPSWTPSVDESMMMQSAQQMVLQGQSAPPPGPAPPPAPAPMQGPPVGVAEWAGTSNSMIQSTPHVVKPRAKVEQPVVQKQASGELNAEPVDEITTLMIRGIPCSFSQDTLMRTIDNAGFKGKYDFFYLPRAGSNGTNLGYAFINFVNQPMAEQCMASLNGFPLDASRSTKICTISEADIQGLANLRKHFRKTAVSRGSRGPVFLKVFTDEESPQ